MQQVLFKCETPQLELKSSHTFLAIKRSQWTKIGKVINLARSLFKNCRISATIGVILLCSALLHENVDKQLEFYVVSHGLELSMVLLDPLHILQMELNVLLVVVGIHIPCHLIYFSGKSHR